MVIYPFLIGTGLLLLSYYIGRELGRTEAIRRQLRESREQKRREVAPGPDMVSIANR